MKVKVIAFTFIIPVIIGIAAIFTVSRLGIEHLIICSTDSEAINIPRSVCKYYLYNFTGRDSARDLGEGAGIAYMYGIQNKKDKYRTIDRLISVGVDVNRVSNIDGLTPLNAAILLNDPELVKYLLGKGASLDKKDRANKLNAKEYIEYLQKNARRADRQKIHQIISNNILDQNT